MWLEILRRFEAVPQFIVTLRNPLEVARSLHARDGFPLVKSMMLWLRHVLDAELHTRGQARTFVAYDELLRDWRAVARTDARRSS